jgi:hypothetical protein
LAYEAPLGEKKEFSDWVAAIPLCRIWYLHVPDRRGYGWNASDVSGYAQAFTIIDFFVFLHPPLSFTKNPFPTF